MRPLYRLVPKGFSANLAYRKRMVLWGSESPENARALWIACSRDCLYWVNVFCWTYAPKDYPRYSNRPFITYPYQDETVADLVKAVEEGHDVFIEKSRDMGASWMVLLVLTWYWTFYDQQSFLLGSRKEEYVDKALVRAVENDDAKLARAKMGLVLGNLSFIARVVPGMEDLRMKLAKVAKPHLPRMR